MLCEMNDDVKGFCVNDSAETLIHRGKLKYDVSDDIIII